MTAVKIIRGFFPDQAFRLGWRLSFSSRTVGRRLISLGKVAGQVVDCIVRVAGAPIAWRVRVLSAFEKKMGELCPEKSSDKGNRSELYVDAVCWKFSHFLQIRLYNVLWVNVPYCEYVYSGVCKVNHSILHSLRTISSSCNPLTKIDLA